MRISEKKEERRKEIVDAAKELFFLYGYNKTSVSNIVDNVGVAKGLFYYYFKSKEEVFEAVMWNYANELVDEFTVIFELNTITFIDKIDKVIEILFFREFQQHDKLLSFSNNNKEHLELRQKITMYATERLITPLSNVLEEELIKKNIKELDVVVAARFIAYGVLGCSQFFNINYDNSENERKNVSSLIKMILL